MGSWRGMLRGSCFIHVEGYPARLWFPWGHSLWLAGLYVPAKLSRDRDAVKAALALEKVALEDDSEAPSPCSWSMEGPAKELSVN